MKDASFYVGGLLDLHRLASPADRRATWRQSLAALAQSTEDEGPGPLDALHPEALLLGVAAALSAGLVDDLDWLEPSKAGAALYELASALPLGSERRELGRRVLARLLEGSAESFVSIATRMALGTGKGLGTPAVRARIALVTELPLGLGVSDGPLALALAQRRDLAREWIELPSTRSLPARRLAARLLERAAREASKRASRGDLHALRAFRVDAVNKAYVRLLADRETLVWRHVAVARGLLAPFVPDLAKELSNAMSADLSPTEWRRGATSIAAQIAVEPGEALRAVRAAVGHGILKRDPGVAAAFVWGIARAAEAEPDAADALLSELVGEGPAVVAEAVIELGTEFGSASFVDRARHRVAEALGRRAQADHGDDGAAALAREILRDLDPAPRDDEPVRQQVARALAAFATEGARGAYGSARKVLAAAKGELDALEALGDDDAGEGRAAQLARRTALAALRDLDMSLLERGVLDDLLRLDPGADRSHEETLDTIRERLANWILARESTPLGAGTVGHPTLRLRRLRALLHLVDSDSGDAFDDGARAARLRDRWRRIASFLTVRFETEPPSLLHRTIVATLARALDALVRVGACDLSDVLLVVARKGVDPAEFETLAEASMDPDLVHVFTRYARFLGASEGKRPREQLGALEELSRELIPDGSGRRESLRAVLVRLHGALAAVHAAPSLRSLSSTWWADPDLLGALEMYTAALTQIAAGARTRLAPVQASTSTPPSLTEGSLTLAVSRVLEGVDASVSEAALKQWTDELEACIPLGLARVVAACALSLAKRPRENPDVAAPSAHVRVAEAQLPAWLPARRTLGGFYLLRPLGKGAVGSVFICTRAEDRNDPAAEQFALKVPEYSATAARNLSEAEFLQLFRAEASALIAIPSHPNLARFVTFDAGARPKPILVMELVEGIMLERVIASRTFDAGRALGALDGVLAGLEAMHAAGVGHLDLKPSNVVLRRGQEAVLVDFGLAGRHVRPGCATGPYGAPEVWGLVPDGVEPSPPPADIYAFGCLAFEALTGKVLFSADNEVAQISLHVAHDGRPAQLEAMRARPGLSPLVELLGGTLRRDPRDRPSAHRVRSELRRLAPAIAGMSWPL